MAAVDPFDRRDDLGPPPPVEPKSSGCWKWGLIFGGVGLVCLLLCCGIMGVVGYRMQPTIVQQPAEVDAMAQEIATIDIPDTFVGKMGMSMNLGFMSMKMCGFEEAEGRGQLQLVEMAVHVGDPQQGREQLRQEMRKQGNSDMRTLDITESQSREFEIRGDKTTFSFAKGTDPSTSTVFHEIRGEFPGKNGLAMLHLQVEEAAYNEEEIVGMIESIK